MNFKYKIIISKKRKTFKIRITEEKEIIIYSPYRLSRKEAENIINSNMKQINELMNKLEKRRLPSVTERGWIYVLGEKIPLKIIEIKNDKLSLKYDRNIINIYKSSDNNEDKVKDLIKVWYKKIAKEYLTTLTLKMAKKHNFQINDIRVKDVKTRWGSCSSKRNINLNYKLIMAPKEVIEYVIIHELCHLKEMNHSEKFWREVSNILPNYKGHLEHLKRFGHNYEI